MFCDDQGWLGVYLYIKFIFYSKQFCPRRRVGPPPLLSQEMGRPALLCCPRRRSCTVRSPFCPRRRVCPLSCLSQEKGRALPFVPGEGSARSPFFPRRWVFPLSLLSQEKGLPAHHFSPGITIYVLHFFINKFHSCAP